MATETNRFQKQVPEITAAQKEGDRIANQTGRRTLKRGRGKVKRSMTGHMTLMQQLHYCPNVLACGDNFPNERGQ